MFFMKLLSQHNTLKAVKIRIEKLKLSHNTGYTLKNFWKPTSTSPSSNPRIFGTWSSVHRISSAWIPSLEELTFASRMTVVHSTLVFVKHIRKIAC